MPGPENSSPPLLPLVIFSVDGNFFDAALMDRKAYTKSMERKRLWYYHPETGRVLPYEESYQLNSIRQENGYYKALGEISGAVKSSAGGDTGDTEQKASLEDGHRSSGESIIERLSALIEERKSSLPEGSYTTYLFREGAEKIRKKTGEEAVELILARSKDDIIAESADFLYHLMVYLAAEGLSLEAVLEELARRHARG